LYPSTSTYTCTVSICNCYLFYLFNSKLCPRFFVLVFAHPLATATSLRIYTLFQQRRLIDAQYATFISILQSLLLSLIAGGIIYGLHAYIGYLYTSNQDVIQRTSRMAWYAALLCPAYFLQTHLQAISRALGYQMDSLGLVITYYIIHLFYHRINIIYFTSMVFVVGDC
jgi:Na+-driven multidrug efflux pump